MYNCLCRVCTVENWHVPGGRLCLWLWRGSGSDWLDKPVKKVPFNDKRFDFIVFIFSSKTNGWMVLNAERKSTRAYTYGWLRCLRSRCTRVLTAWSVPRLSLYANWKGSSTSLTSAYNFLITSLSRHFMTIEVRATGLKSFLFFLSFFFLSSSLGHGFWGLEWCGTFSLRTAQFACKVKVETGHQRGASSLAHVFKRTAEKPSGPVAFLAHVFLKILATWSVDKSSVSHTKKTRFNWI